MSFMIYKNDLEDIYIFTILVRLPFCSEKGFNELEAYAALKVMNVKTEEFEEYSKGLPGKMAKEVSEKLGYSEVFALPFDDHEHHPQELERDLNNLRPWIICLFERFTKDDFRQVVRNPGDSLCVDQVDQVILLPIEKLLFPQEPSEK